MSLFPNEPWKVKNGRLTAIMGSSGAGKSTLMNIVAQRNLKNLNIQGSLKVNGHEYSGKISNISAYVQQNDIFVGSLTVREYLTFIVRLRLSDVSEVEQETRIDELLHTMALEGCQNSLIGNPGLTKTISGGEMKRLSVACGLARNPNILFLDEPTSGLDAYLAHQ